MPLASSAPSCSTRPTCLAAQGAAGSSLARSPLGLIEALSGRRTHKIILKSSLSKAIKLTPEDLWKLCFVRKIKIK